MKITFLNQHKAKKEDESKWFHSCVEKNTPYVVARKQGGHSNIEWDCITMKIVDSEFVYTQNEFIYHELNELIKYYWNSKTVMQVGSLSGFVKNLPTEAIEDFATDVCNTLSEAYKRHNQEI